MSIFLFARSSIEDLEIFKINSRKIAMNAPIDNETKVLIPPVGITLSYTCIEYSDVTNAKIFILKDAITA